MPSPPVSASPSCGLEKPLRADVALVKRGLCESRAKARAAIEAGTAFVNDRKISKPSEKISANDILRASAAHSWVSRGGLKLEGALSAFGVDPAGQVCLDVGASTGGFTDVLLSRGAAKIYAVDVGTAQLHPKLREDSRVICLEKMDARDLTPAHFNPPFHLIVCDASFISAMKVLARPMAIARAGCGLICLVKPQFEVGPSGLSRGGIVRDASLAQDALYMVKNWVREQGWELGGECDSPIKGGSGNHEFLLHAVKR